MRNLVVLALMLFPVAGSAQQGSIQYDRAVQFDYSLLPADRPQLRELIPPQSFTPMVLFFNESESLMTEAANGEVEAPPILTDRAVGLATRVKMGSSARSDQETLLAAYMNSEDGTATEMLEFMGRDFLITGEQVVYPWRLTGEQSEFLGYVVHRAVADLDGTTVEAWFTPEIPVSAGPGGYGGLPGMILVVSINNEQLVYSATEVRLDPLDDGLIVVPTEGDQVSRDEYEEIVVEKLEELRTTRQPAQANARLDRVRDNPGGR